MQVQGAGDSARGSSPVEHVGRRQPHGRRAAHHRRQATSLKQLACILVHVATTHVQMQSRRNYAVAELPPALRGHLAVGTMLPSARADGEEGEGDGVVLLEVQQQQQREGSDAAGAGGGAEQQESEEEALAAARQLEADLCRQYPHGVPVSSRGGGGRAGGPFVCAGDAARAVLSQPKVIVIVMIF